MEHNTKIHLIKVDINSRSIKLKFNQKYLYNALFIGLFAILVISDYSRSNSFNWLGNLMQASFIIFFYILIMKATLNKITNQK